MYYHENTVVFLDGEYVKATEAKVDLYTQTLHYGMGVFEGIRSYRLADGGTRIFKAVEHFERLRNSAAAMNLPFSWTTANLIAATYEVLEKNGLQDAYIRPLVYGPANMSFNLNKETHIVIEAWPMQPFLGDKLLRVMTSSFQRPNPRGFRIHAKATGHYVNSILASQEAKAAGFDEALLLDIHDHIAEGPGANIFFEKENRLYTPAPGHILPGITRDTVFEICEELDIRVEEGKFSLHNLKQAEAVFYCGTAAEVIGWESLDNHAFPLAWESSLSKQVADAYKRLVIGLPVKEYAEEAE